MTNINFRYTLVFIRAAARKKIFVVGCIFFEMGAIWGGLDYLVS